MPRLTRRRLLAAGGAGAAASVLAACGASEAEEERDAGEDAELLQAVRAPEADLESTYRALSKGAAGPGEQAPPGALMSALQERSLSRTQELNTLFEEAVAEGTRPPAPLSEGGAVGLAMAVALLERAIAADREAAALLSTVELRATAYERVAARGGELAVVRAVLGEEPAPFAFVTGQRAEPYEDTGFDATEGE